jgi:hypothetical protein
MTSTVTIWLTYGDGSEAAISADLTAFERAMTAAAEGVHGLVRLHVRRSAREEVGAPCPYCCVGEFTTTRRVRIERGCLVEHRGLDGRRSCPGSYMRAERDTPKTDTAPPT